MAIGYPLSGEYAHDSFERALAAALRRVPKRLEGVDCWAIGPDLPARLAGHVTDRDTFYILPCDAPVPARLRRPVEIAAEKLTVREGRDFTPAHRRLWAEFMNRAVLPPNVRGLFARTGAVLDTPGLRLLDAVDAEGNLAASLLLDDAPRRFCSYLIGAHSRTHYTPHAADLLFAHMLRSAREADKEYVHLGLGVNDGIRRFKTKWGGRPALPYVMASWRETPRETGSETISSLVRILLESPSDLQAPDFRLAAPAAALRHALGTDEKRQDLMDRRHGALFLLFVRGGFPQSVRAGGHRTVRGPARRGLAGRGGPHRQDARRQAPAPDRSA